MRDGKKTKVIKIFNNIFSLFKLIFNINLNIILFLIFKRLKPLIYLKEVRNRRRIFKNAYLVNKVKQIYFVVNWLKIFYNIKIKSLKKNSYNILIKEFYNILLNKGEIIQKKKKHFKVTVSNKFMYHFRW